MNLKELKDYCYTKKDVSDDFPFDEETLVFRVCGKMFALTNINSKKLSVNLKCDPTIAEQLRSEFKEIIPGYHMNKKHWNTVDFTGSLTKEKLMWLIDHSYELVFNKLTKKEKERISKL